MLIEKPKPSKLAGLSFWQSVGATIRGAYLTPQQRLSGRVLLAIAMCALAYLFWRHIH